MSNMITFEMDHSFAGDIASLGIEYQTCDDNEYIRATVNKWQCDDTLFAWLDDNCDGWE